MAQIKGLTIKGITRFKGHEGEPCNQGNIYIGGKNVGYYTDSFTMGPPDINFDTKEAEQEAERICREYYAQHPDEKWFEDKDADLDEFLCKVFSLIDAEREYKKFAKKGYPVLVVYEEQAGLEQLVGYTTIEYAKKQAESNIKAARYKIYSQPTDFIIE